MHDLIAKAATLIDALPYIHKFSGEIVIIRNGGGCKTAPTLVALRRGILLPVRSLRRLLSA